MDVIQAYRSFAGVKAAFSVEYTRMPGEFESKQEETEFFLGECLEPVPYETVCRRQDEDSYDLANAQVELDNTKRSRNIWRGAALVFVFWYLAHWVV